MAANDDSKANSLRKEAFLEEGSAATIDINDMRISVLIICRTKELFENAANYLIRRGWNTAITPDVMSGFRQIGTFKPDFVMISVNLQTSKIEQLPTLMSSTFNVPVITFGENNEPRTQKLLADVHADYVMQGPLSGPGIQRRLKTILQEMHRSGDSIGQKIFNRQLAYQNPETKKPDVVKGDELLGVASDEKKPREKGLGIFVAKGAAQDDKTVNFNSNEKSETISNEEEERRAAKIQKGEEELNKWFKTEQKSSTGSGAKQKKEEITDNFTSRTPAIPSSKKSDHLHPSKSTTDINIGQPMRPEPSASLGRPRTPEEAHLEGLILHSARAAAQSAADPKIELHLATRCTLWPVTYGSFSGLVLIAHGGNLSEEDVFATQFIDYLKNQGRRQRQKLEVSGYISTELESVNLNERVEGEIFSKKIRSGINEIIVKLIEVKQQRINLASENLKERVKITSQHLFINLPPGACLYLHMPINERYFLYLRDSSVLSAKQYERLEKTKTDLYLRTEDMDRFKQTYAYNALVQKIRDMKKTNKKAG